MTNSIIIGKKIAECRKSKGVSQAEFAQNMNVTPQAVSKWERGDSLPDVIALSEMAAYFGKDINYFFDIPPAGGENAPFAAAGESPAAEGANPQETSEAPRQKNRKYNMSHYNWKDGDFSRLESVGDRFSGSNIGNCKFNYADLSGVVLRGNNLKNSELKSANLSGSRFSASNIINNDFTSSNLKGTVFSASNVNGNDFSGADLTGAEFKASTIGKCGFTGAVIKNAEFKNSSFSNIVIGGNIEDCSFTGCGFRKTEFLNATLKRVFFKNQRMRGATFVNCRADNLTIAFLKNCKANVDNIQLIEE